MVLRYDKGTSTTKKGNPVNGTVAKSKQKPEERISGKEKTVVSCTVEKTPKRL